MSVPVPAAVVDALAGVPEVGTSEAASVLATVDADGSPRLTLLSRAELDADAAHVRLTLAGRSTPANLERTGRATLLVVSGETAHTCVLGLVASGELEGIRGYVTELVAHRADSVGVELTPLSYVPSSQLPSAERWRTSARLLDRLRADGTGG